VNLQLIENDTVESAIEAFGVVVCGNWRQSPAPRGCQYTMFLGGFEANDGLN
jgi:hypothetical protein